MFSFGKKITGERPATVSGAPDSALARHPSAAAAPTTTAAPFLPPQSIDFIRDVILERVEPVVAVQLSQQELTERVGQLVAEIANEQRILLNRQEQLDLTDGIINDMIGLGPLEALLRDDSIADILVNGPQVIYVERRGRLELTGLQFRHNAHVLHVAQRIASTIGRRVDESSPMLDARLADGSRVNVIIPPLSLKGPCISIRKFSKAMMDFAKFITVGTVSSEMARALEIAARCRLNIIISGGTGSGKTSLWMPSRA